jgi:hypothetical protein
MRAMIVAAIVLSFLGACPAFAGPCDHAWQTASDGSSCGGRAADQRPGGN